MESSEQFDYLKKINSCILSAYCLKLKHTPTLTIKVL